VSSMSDGEPANRKNIPLESVLDIRVHGKLLTSVRFTGDCTTNDAITLK
jgi:hypothetical protein